MHQHRDLGRQGRSNAVDGHLAATASHAIRRCHGQRHVFHCGHVDECSQAATEPRAITECQLRDFAAVDAWVGLECQSAELAQSE
eukprot:2937601-Prymnesium_polylepis.1